jgi:two-component system sensor histidine kinase DegS
MGDDEAGPLAAVRGLFAAAEPTDESVAGPALEPLVRRLHLQDVERRRLADALHDGPVQALASVGIRLGTFRTGLLDDDQRQAVTALEAEVRRALGGIRSLIVELAPPDVDQDLTVPLRSYLEETFGPEVACRLVVDQPDPLPHDVATAAFHIVRLALGNVRDHAAASALAVDVAVTDDRLEGQVVDDGIGAPAEVLLASLPGHLGLRRMHEHAEALGGWVRVASQEGGGVTVRFSIPLDGSLAT